MFALFSPLPPVQSVVAFFALVPGPSPRPTSSPGVFFNWHFWPRSEFMGLYTVLQGWACENVAKRPDLLLLRHTDAVAGASGAFDPFDRGG